MKIWRDNEIVKSRYKVEGYFGLYVENINFWNYSHRKFWGKFLYYTIKLKSMDLMCCTFRITYFMDLWKKWKMEWNKGMVL